MDDNEKGGLVICRKPGQEIWINGGEIKIIVGEKRKGNCVPIVIKADRSKFKIDRPDRDSEPKPHHPWHSSSSQTP